MTNLTATIDAYAALKAEIGRLELRKKELEAALAELPAGAYESADFRLTISDVEGSKHDAKLGAEVKAVLKAAERAASDCECFLVVGTSAIVFPAAGLIRRAREAGAPIIEFNLEPTAASVLATVCLHGPSGQLLPEVVRRLG